jgi:hypothetical protein
MEERIVGPDPVAEPDAYAQALLDLLGGRDALEVLRTTPQRFTELCRRLWIPVQGGPARLDEDRVHLRPAEGEWSVAELLAHLFDAEVAYSFRWRVTLAQEAPVYPGYDQEAWITLAHPPFPELLTAFVSLRRANVTLITSIPRETDPVGHHEERGEEPFWRSVHLVAGHDLAHLEQLAQTLAVVAAS